jgi:hypothetical protein
LLPSGGILRQGWIRKDQDGYHNRDWHDTRGHECKGDHEPVGAAIQPRCVWSPPWQQNCCHPTENDTGAEHPVERIQQGCLACPERQKQETAYHMSSLEGCVGQSGRKLRYDNTHSSNDEEQANTNCGRWYALWNGCASGRTK